MPTHLPNRFRPLISTPPFVPGTSYASPIARCVACIHHMYAPRACHHCLPPPAHDGIGSAGAAARLHRAAAQYEAERVSVKRQDKPDAGALMLHRPTWYT